MQKITPFLWFDSQAEVDHYRDKLSAGGDPAAQRCGWLKDKFGVSWQIVPTVLPELLQDPDASKAGNTMQALMQMSKLDIGALKRAIAAGAKITMPVADMFWGDRYGKIEDPFGHHWSVATHIRDVSPEEMQQAMQKMGN